MININTEGFKPENEEKPEGLTLEQERVLLLEEAKVILSRLMIKKLELEVVGINDEITRRESARLEADIEKNKKLIEDMGGTIDFV